MHRPENEEDNEEVVQVPESFKVRTTRLLDRCCEDHHQCCEHDIASPARTSGEVGKKEAFEAELVLCGELGKVIPMGYSMNPGKEDNRVCYEFMKRDVLICESVRL
jgi:hypothetical protein